MGCFASPNQENRSAGIPSLMNIMPADRQDPKENAMSATTTIQQLNREFADKLIEEAKRDPQSPYIWKFVGIANGQIVVVADDLDEGMRRLDQVEPDPSKTFFIEVGHDYDKVYEI
jgi:hypothetical protein